jgi:hypothetical protein
VVHPRSQNHHQDQDQDQDQDQAVEVTSLYQDAFESTRHYSSQSGDPSG